jgi:hypothetical protein
MVEHLDDVATACRALSKGCSDLADGIDKAHNDVKNELVSLLEWTAGIEAGGLLVGIFTAGIGEGAAQAAEAGRIAAMASRVGKFIQTLVELAGTVGRAIGTVFTKIGEIAQRLQRLLGVRVTQATSEAASKAPAAAKDAETTAEDSLAAASKLPAGVKPGWASRTADNGKGTVYQEPGAAGNAAQVRIMEPTTQYPNGYVRFYNEHGQPVGLDGKPGPNSTTHIPRAPDGTYPLPQGW